MKIAAKLLVAAGFFATGLASTALRAETLSYHGWTGSVDVNGNQFMGCHLDSPPAVSERHDQIRVIAESAKDFFVEFVARFENPQPAPGQRVLVALSVVNGEHILSDDWHSVGSGYKTNALGNGVAADGKPFTRVLLGIGADDEINSHLKGARYLKIYWPASIAGLSDINFSTIDLRHRSITNPKTLLSALEANDTYGAVQTVIACARGHANVAAAPPVSGETAAGGSANVNASLGHLCSAAPVMRTAQIAFGEMYLSTEAMNALHVNANDLADAFTLRDTVEGTVHGQRQACTGTIGLVKEWFDARGRSVSPESISLAGRTGLAFMAAAFLTHPDGLEISYTVDTSSRSKVTVTVQNPITLASWTLLCGQCGGF